MWLTEGLLENPKVLYLIDVSEVEDAQALSSLDDHHDRDERPR